MESLQKYVDRLLKFQARETATATALRAERDNLNAAIAELKMANADKDALIAQLLAENASLKGENADQQTLIAKQQEAIALTEAAFGKVEESQAAVEKIDITPVQTEIVESVITDPAIETPAVVEAAQPCAPCDVPATEVVEAAIEALATFDAPAA